MVTVVVLSVAEMFVTVEPLTVSLNRKSESAPAPVSTNLFPLVSTTSTVTVDAVACVSVTVPNDVAVPQPAVGCVESAVIWHDVRVNVSAWLTLGNAALPASNAAPANATRHEKLCMMISILRVCKPAAKHRIHSQQKALPKL